MKSIPRWTLSLAIGAACAASAQTGPASPPTRGEVAIVHILEARYPPLARQANITGDVELRLAIRKDGTVQSADAVSGHPMLTEAALKSAKLSLFECRRCQDELTLYSITYSFQIVASPGWPCPEQGGSHVRQSGNHVTITGEPSLVYPVFSSVQVRSAKCAYLWACGRHWGGEDYYYYRARSAKCLDLWNCAHRLREPFATCQKLHRKLSY